VSTAKQGFGVSLIAQKEAIEKYAHQHDLKIVQWFEEVLSASKTGRPLFLEMMKLLHKKKADGAVIHKIDRSARNLDDWTDVVRIVDQFPDVDIHFAHEGVDLRTRAGRLSADVQAVFAADYSRNLRQETIKGLYTRLKQGIYPFAAPIGYKDTGKGRLKVIDPVQGALVKQAFNLYSSRKYTLRTLLAKMNALGLRNIRGHKLCVNSLGLVLNNSFYMGVLKVKGISYVGKHEPLIKPELFKRVQAIIRSKTNQKTNKHSFVYSKRLKCGECGYSMIGERQRGNIYYRCHNKVCPTKGVRESTIEKQVKESFSKVQLLQTEIDSLNHFLNTAEQEWFNTQNEMLASIKLQKGQIEKTIERLTDFYLDGSLDKEMYLKRKENLLADFKTKESVEIEISDSKERIFKKARNFLELSKTLVRCYEKGIVEEKQELLQKVTSNLTVNGKNLEIAMRSPFLEVSERQKLTSCCLERGEARKDNGISIEQNTFSSKPKALSQEALKSLLDKILEACANLPDTEDGEF
jgi:DNA invertase Pin-like site-specific DNA recombinase